MTLAQARHVPTFAADAVPVTPDNFVRAETDLYFGGAVRKRRLRQVRPHARARAARQPDRHPPQPRHAVLGGRVRPRRRAGDDHAARRGQALHVAAGDRRGPVHATVVYGAGSHTLTREEVGTRYVVAAVRTLVDPADPKDVEQVHALQDAIRVEQPGGPGKFEVPNWDPASQKKVRDALLVLGATLPDYASACSARKDEVDPVRHLIGAATAWGGNPEKDAMYLNVTPTQERRQDDLQARRSRTCPSTASGRSASTTPKGYFEKNAAGRLLAQQHHREEGRRRLGRRPVRRLRRQDPELPADHAGLELHRAPLPPARRNPGRHMEVPRGAARELRPPGGPAITDAGGGASHRSVAAIWEAAEDKDPDQELRPC